MHNLIFTLLAAVGASAHSQDTYTARCQPFLGITVEHLGERPTDIVWMNGDGIGVRGFKTGAHPPINAETEAVARRQGIVSWSHAISVAPSEEAARRDDQHRIPYRQTMYLIADRGIDDLISSESVEGLTDFEKISRRRAAQQRFAELFRDGNARVIYFRNRRFDPDQHEQGDVPAGGVRPLFWRNTERKERVPRDLVVVDHERARLMLHADEMGFINDGYGPRFVQYGWFRPPMRGVLNLATSFAPNGSGTTPKSSFIKGGYNLISTLVKLGWTVRENVSIDEVIALEKATSHNVKKTVATNGVPAANSRYLEPHVEEMTRDAYYRGEAGTLELRDPEGVLRAAIVLFYGPGLHMMMDCTAGQDAPKAVAEKKAHDEKDIYKGVELRKGMMAAGIVWAEEKGYPSVDITTVTEMTNDAKGFYVPADEWEETILSAPAPERFYSPEAWVPPTYREIYENFPRFRRPRRPRILP